MLKSIVVLITYLFCGFGVGHALAPLFLILIAGSGDFGAAWLIGCICVVGLIAQFWFCNEQSAKKQAFIQLILMMGLYLSWFIFVYKTNESKITSSILLTSVAWSFPFQIAWGISIVLVIRDIIRGDRPLWQA